MLLINGNIDLRATIVRVNADKEELEVELRLRKKASRKPDIKPPAESGKVSPGLTCAVERRAFLAGANPARQLSLQPVAARAVYGGNDMD